MLTRHTHKLLATSAILAATLSFAMPSLAEVTIIHGPTPIKAGNAKSDKDITVKNETGLCS